MEQLKKYGGERERESERERERERERRHKISDSRNLIWCKKADNS